MLWTTEAPASRDKIVTARYIRYSSGVGCVTDIADSSQSHRRSTVSQSSRVVETRSASCCDMVVIAAQLCLTVLEWGSGWLAMRGRGGHRRRV